MVVVEWAVKAVAWRRRQVEVGCYTWRTSCTPHWRVRLVSAPDELMRRPWFCTDTDTHSLAILRERDN